MGIKDTQSDQPKGYGKGNQATMKGDAAASDTSGERREMLRGGVAMGKKDGLGANHQYNGGRTKGVCYTHTRDAYMDKG